MEEITGQPCNFCGKKAVTLREDQIDIPHFGKVYVLGMECTACGVRKSEVEPAEQKEPCKYVFEISSEDDLSVKIVKSGEATVKIPHVITMEPGPASSGYVTNIEGLLERVKKIIANVGEAEDNPAIKKKVKNQIKKLNKVLLGREKLKISIEDPSGHSAIISDKATCTKL